MKKISRLRHWRKPPRNARETFLRLWQSGGLLLLGALAAGMTAFPAQTLVLLRPFSTALTSLWRTGLGGLEAVREAGRTGQQAVRSLAYRAEEGEEYKRQILALEQKSVLKEERQRELLRLSRLLQLKEELGVPARAARVIGGDPSGLLTSLVLDTGARDGVREGAAVVAAAGAVGHLISVGADHAVALWLCDPRSRIAAVVQRSRVIGVLVGLGRHCELRYLSVGDDVQVGDRVLTAGRGSAFPRGVLLGVIKEIRRDGLLLAAHIAPAVRINRLEEVLILNVQRPSVAAKRL